jgi:hypothetical protein
MTWTPAPAGHLQRGAAHSRREADIARDHAHGHRGVRDPLSLTGLLIATSRYYEILNVLSLFIPFGLLNAALLCLGRT